MNSKDKGNGFERKISKTFSTRFKAITGITDSFRRNIDSGSFFGATNQKRTLTHNLEKATFGDIVCPEKFKYNIECKHYKTAPSFALLLKQSCKEWDKWILQNIQDSKHANRLPLLIIKYNNVEEFVIVENIYNLDFVMKYNNNYITTLETFLTLPDSVFFDI